MPKKKHSVDQIIGKLRQAEVELSKGETVRAVVRKLGIAEQTYYRWRKEYGGLKRDQARRFKILERENARLKRIVADQQIDILDDPQTSGVGSRQSKSQSHRKCRRKTPSTGKRQAGPDAGRARAHVACASRAPPRRGG
jgi:putative transposase